MSSYLQASAIEPCEVPFSGHMHDDLILNSQKLSLPAYVRVCAVDLLHRILVGGFVVTNQQAYNDKGGCTTGDQRVQQYKAVRRRTTT